MSVLMDSAVLRVFKIILLSVAQKMTVQHAAQDDSK
jgi:hypothetical protein